RAGDDDLVERGGGATCGASASASAASAGADNADSARARNTDKGRRCGRNTACMGEILCGWKARGRAWWNPLMRAAAMEHLCCCAT
ncbi:hypothetical protein CATMIT_02014, partial [Catenibacterium mitsuokai DSM 15897]